MGKKKRSQGKKAARQEKPSSGERAEKESAPSFPPAPPPKRSRWQLALSSTLLALWFLALVILVVLANR